METDFLNSAYRSLSQSEFDVFCQFELIFLQKNSEINLSAIRDQKGVWEKHFYDSLLGGSYIKKYQPQKILDIGSGGGFPCIPLAIVFPQIQFFPLDSVEKKMKALSEMTNTIGVKNISPICERAENLARNPRHRAQYEFVVARAVAPFPVLLEISIPFVQIGGIFLAYRGPEESTEDNLLIQKMGGSLKSKQIISLPSGEKRTLWEIEKTRETDPKFPRKAGTPKKNPLTIQDF
jgi:16S rRNA (guanine527-N7)-methyltransferase